MMRVSLVEQAVQTPPPGMDGWRMYRIEYGGHAECCLCEGVLWLPMRVDATDAERLLTRLCNGRRVTLPKD